MALHSGNNIIIYKTGEILLRGGTWEKLSVGIKQEGETRGYYLTLSFYSGSNMLGYLRCKLGGGDGEGSISGMANAYIQRSMVST